MRPAYLHLSPVTRPPERQPAPYRAVIVSDMETTPEWRSEVADWLVRSGCLYVVAWGVQCEAWDDAVDWAILEKFEFADIPDEHLVMTTWHDKEPLGYAFWFAGVCASHPIVDLQETLIIDIAAGERENELLEKFAASQVVTEGR